MPVRIGSDRIGAGYAGGGEGGQPDRRRHVGHQLEIEHEKMHGDRLFFVLPSLCNHKKSTFFQMICWSKAVDPDTQIKTPTQGEGVRLGLV